MAEKQIPPAVQAALEASARLQAEGLWLPEMQKLLPAFAVKLAREGETVTVKRLLAEARKGVGHLKAPPFKKPSRKEKPLVYAEVVARLKPPAPKRAAKEVPEDEWPIDDTIEKHIERGEVMPLLRMVDDGWIEPIGLMQVLVRSENQETALLAARILLESCTFNLNQHWVVDKLAPLHCALANGHGAMVRLLLQYGADVHFPTATVKRPAVSFCTTPEHLALMVEHGAVLESAGLDGRTILHSMVVGAKTEMVAALLRYGVEINSRTKNNESVLHLAGSAEMVRLLLEAGANPNLQDKEGCTALHAAIVEDRGSEVLALLIAHGADITLVESIGLTPLHYAAELNNVEYVQQLCAAGADVHAKSKKDETPLNRALLYPSIRAMEQLLLLGALPGDLKTAKQIKTIQEDVRWEREDNTSIHFLYKKLYDSARKIDDAELKALAKIFAQEYREEINESAIYCAITAYTLFGGMQNTLRYLERWGKQGPQPLIQALKDACELQDVFNTVRGLWYQDKAVTTDFNAWAEAMIACGPAMARYFKYFDCVPAPLRGEDGKLWSPLRTKDAVIQTCYARAGEDMPLARQCFDGKYDDTWFEMALRAKGVHLGEKRLPKVEIEGEVFGKPGYRFHLLEEGDPRGLLLGIPLNNCQHIKSNGMECAWHGHFSRHGGFYVLEHPQKGIVAEAWAWRGEQGEVVLDSLENLPGHMNITQWSQLLGAFARAVVGDAKVRDVSALHLGTNGGTPVGLLKLFQRAATLPQPRGYDGHRDSHLQVQIPSQAAKVLLISPAT